MNTILLVDDETEILEILAEEFLYRGVTSITATSGREAIQKIQTNSAINFVLSDFKMPNGSGLDILNFLKSSNPSTLLAFYSGQSDISPNECISLGAVEYFHKPQFPSIVASQIISKYLSI